MADRRPELEIADDIGSTGHYNGSADTAISVPASAGNAISEVLVHNIGIQANRVLLLSFDGGTNWKRIGAGGSLGWTFKGGQTQFMLKSLTPGISVPYECIVNFEDADS